MTQTTFTVREAALALGVHKRTIQRRIDDGSLSAKLVQRGKQQVRVIEGAELARFAEANGYTLTVGAGAPLAQEAQETSAVRGNRPDASDDRPAPTAATATVEECPSCAGLRLALEARGELVQALTSEVVFLREQLRLLTTRALPPTASPGKPGLWARLFRRKEDTSGGK